MSLLANLDVLPPKANLFSLCRLTGLTYGKAWR